MIEPLGLVVYNSWDVGVVIPARNEQEHIGEVLESIPDFVDHVIVINDGSNDSTGKIAEGFSNSHYTLEILENHGQGVGSSIDKGHIRMLEISKKPFVSVVIAGDGQMNPLDMESVILPIVNRNSDYVKGDRFNHKQGLGKMPLIRKWASLILAFFTTLASGRKISDPQCGYTATSYEVLMDWNWDKSWRGYGYPNYWLINLSRGNWRVNHVPVQSIYGNQKSSIKGLYFFISVGIMMAIEHHKRVFAKLFSLNVNPHTMFSFISYLIGWIALVPWFSTDLERTLVDRGVPIVVIVLCSWTAAHIFDRLSINISLELKQNAKNRSKK